MARFARVSASKIAATAFGVLKSSSIAAPELFEGCGVERHADDIDADSLSARRTSASSRPTAGGGGLELLLAQLGGAVVVRSQHGQAEGARSVVSSASAMVVKLPTDFAIFSPPLVTMPACTQWRANG